MSNGDQAKTQGEWQSFVLLPSADVPMAGSRTEIVVTPNECLRVQVKVGPDGVLQFRLEE